MAGVIGVLAKHVPTIGVLKPGVVDVTDNEGLKSFLTLNPF
jgi:F-type H+-transporting ATPase subunit delta